MREAFEHWFSDEGAYPLAITRNGDGGYRLSAAESAWITWQAAWDAALTAQILPTAPDSSQG